MDVPVGNHQFPHEGDTGLHLLRRPARQLAVQPAHQRRVRHDAVLASDPVLGRPLAELPDEIVGDLVRHAPPVHSAPLVLAHGGELRKSEAVQIYQAGRIIDDQRNRCPGPRVAGVEVLHPRRTFSAQLGHRRLRRRCRGCGAHELPARSVSHGILSISTITLICAFVIAGLSRALLAQAAPGAPIGSFLPAVAPPRELRQVVGPFYVLTSALPAAARPDGRQAVLIRDGGDLPLVDPEFRRRRRQPNLSPRRQRRQRFPRSPFSGNENSL